MVSGDNLIVSLPYGQYSKSDYKNGHGILDWTSNTWKCVYLFEGGLHLFWSTLNRHDIIMNHYYESFD